MAGRKPYSEKFLLPDPFAGAQSRTSTYRLRTIKKRRIDASNDMGSDLPSYDDVEDLATSDNFEDSSILDDQNEDAYSSDGMHKTIEDSQNDSELQLAYDSDLDLLDDYQALCERSAFLEELDLQEEQKVVESDDDSTYCSDFTTEPEADNTVNTSGVTPLYEGSSLTMEASSVLVMQFKTRHNITTDGLADLLKLLKMHCPKPNRCLPTPYLFMKQFNKAKHHVEYHHFCSACLTPVLPANRPVCSNDACKENLQRESSRSSFIEVDIESQIQALFKRKYQYLKAHGSVLHSLLTRPPSLIPRPLPLLGSGLGMRLPSPYMHPKGGLIILCTSLCHGAHVSMFQIILTALYLFNN